MDNLVFLLAVMITCQGSAAYNANTYTKIYNGADAPANAYPWMAELVYKKGPTPFCAAVLVSPSHVLTTAHCLGGVSIEDIVVYLGDHNLTAAEVGEQKIAAKQATVHPDFSGKPLDYDVAVIELSKPAKLKRKYVQTIELLRSEKRFNRIVRQGKRVSLTGWGYKKFYTGWRPSEVLQKLDVKVVSDGECDERGAYRSLSSFCYEAARDECAGSCTGDSGAPLVVRWRGDNLLVGIHSYRNSVYDGCVTGLKGAERVYLVADWLDSVIAQ